MNTYLPRVLLALQKHDDGDPCLGCEEMSVPHGSDGGHRDVREETAEKKQPGAWKPPEHVDPNAEHASSSEEVAAMRRAGAL